MLAMFLAVRRGRVAAATPRCCEAASTIAPVTATAIVLLLFLGAFGKSAQLPLYVWLPDAMAGPDAGLGPHPRRHHGHRRRLPDDPGQPAHRQAYDWAPERHRRGSASLTALFAATIAVAQNDIKKVLAYSTVSQLGYMFLAVGTGAYVAAIFHMVTHAFFKALLFLGSGSVIHGMHDEQDMRKMGGLRKFMPITAATFIVGWLAIAGVPPFAGFWSQGRDPPVRLGRQSTAAVGASASSPPCSPPTT